MYPCVYVMQFLRNCTNIGHPGEGGGIVVHTVEIGCLMKYTKVRRSDKYLLGFKCTLCTYLLNVNHCLQN